MDSIVRPYFISTQYTFNVYSIELSCYNLFRLLIKKCLYVRKLFDKEKVFYVITRQSRYNLYERTR